MRILKFNKKYIKEMALLFAESFSENDPSHIWNINIAGKNLQTYYKYFGNYCFMAIQNGECVGAIFCLTDPTYQGTMLHIMAIMVKNNYRKKGVGKALLNRVFDKCKKDNILGIKLMADSRKNFPKSWYQQLGFNRSGWVEYELFL